jgi:DNA-binding XRE family transcriptional regulator
VARRKVVTITALQQYREAAGLRTIELAAAAHVTEQQVKNLEAGKHSPNLSTAQRLAAALGCGVDDIFPPPTANVMVGSGSAA